MDIVHIREAQLERREGLPFYNCWSWLNGSVEIFHNDYHGPSLYGKHTFIFVDHVQQHLLEGCLTPSELWPLLSEICLNHGYICEAVENNGFLPLPDEMVDSLSA